MRSKTGQKLEDSELPGELAAVKQLSAKCFQSLEYLYFRLMMKQKEFRTVTGIFRFKINSFAGKDLFPDRKTRPYRTG